MHEKPPNPSNHDVLAELLTGVATGRLSVEAALAEWTSADGREQDSENQAPATTPPLTLDLDRQQRCGFPEVVYGHGKPRQLIREIIERQQQAKQPSLVTRIDPAAAAELQDAFSHARFNELARTLSVGIDQLLEPQTPPATDASLHAAVISAGSTDAAVAEEAIETLAWMGVPVQVFYDIGVAGPQRLLAAVPELRRAAAVVVVAGMEGALPAAVGGHLNVPVFAVPTSVGYGATLGGLTPMLGMLSCCASNVAVVNIDAGFKAGYLAGLVVHGRRSSNEHST